MKHIYTYLGVLFILTLSFGFSGCSSDSKNQIPEDLEGIVVDKTVIRLLHNEEITANIITGNGDYLVKSFNEEIATASIAGDQITIKSAQQNGATTVKVVDKKGAFATISVNVGVFAIELNKSEVSLEMGQDTDIEVNMGNFSSNEDLIIQIEDESVASITNTDVLRPYYQIKGLKIGVTKIVFTDKLGETAEVVVTVNPVSIEVSNLIPHVGVNNKLQISIEKGNGGYTVESENDEIVSVKLSGDTTFVLLGNKVGETHVIVKDKEEQELRLLVMVDVADKVAELGNHNHIKVPFLYNGSVDSSLKKLNDITYEARFRINDLNGSGDARINSVMGIEGIFLLRVDVHKGGKDSDRYLQLAADKKGSIRFEGSTKIETYKWYDVAVVLDSSKSGIDKLSLYVNGEKESLQLTAGTIDDLKDIDLINNFFIGLSDGKRRLNGALSYARIWTIPLTDDQIRSQSGTVFTNERDGLVANWLFNNGSGNINKFVSMTNKAYEAEAVNVVTSWVEDPILKDPE